MNDTITKTKRAAKIKPIPAATPKAAAPKAAKPTVAKYDLAIPHTSNVINGEPSKRPLDFSTFGTMRDAKLTQRDLDSIEALRSEFGRNRFERGNLDVGVLRRLGERGKLIYVSGGAMDPNAKFKLAA